TAAVGQYPLGASFYGVEDMAGNVPEFCADWYENKGERKVLRGGGWYVSGDYCDSNLRMTAPPDERGDYGFRLAR
ncbi:MAG: formylglycine-generating enzyme family protein, partial [Elusimicrobiota bacterium]